MSVVNRYDDLPFQRQRPDGSITCVLPDPFRRQRPPLDLFFIPESPQAPAFINPERVTYLDASPVSVEAKKAKKRESWKRYYERNKDLIAMRRKKRSMRKAKEVAVRILESGKREIGSYT